MANWIAPLADGQTLTEAHYAAVTNQHHTYPIGADPVNCNFVGFSNIGPLFGLGNLRLNGVGLRYIENQSNHLATYVSSGGTGFWWRRSDSGLVGGTNERTLMQLDASGGLVLTGELPSIHIGGVNVGHFSIGRDDLFIALKRTNGGVNEKFWDLNMSGTNTSFQLRALNDGYTVATAAFTAHRSGHVCTGVSFDSGIRSPATFLPQGGVGEGGQIYLSDPTGAGVWAVDNYAQSLRFFREPYVGVTLSLNASGQMDLYGNLVVLKSTSAAIAYPGAVTDWAGWIINQQDVAGKNGLAAACRHAATSTKALTVGCVFNAGAGYQEYLFVDGIGRVWMKLLPGPYDSNFAAASAGLTQGFLYRRSDGLVGQVF